MCKCIIVLLSGVVLIASAVSTGDRKNLQAVPYPQPIRSNRNDGGPGGGGGGALGRPADWTMSKANLVAEFYTNEPAAQRKSSTSAFNANLRDRNYKSIFPFPFPIKNGNGNSNPQPNAPFQGHGKHVNVNGNVNLIASGTNYNQQSVNPPPGSGGPGGYSSPFRPIKFPDQNQIIPQNKPDSGYPPNFRQRGPAQPPSPGGGYWDPNRQNAPNQPITNGLRPPAQQPQQLYLPPQNTNQPPPQQQQVQSPDPVPIPQPQNQGQQQPHSQYPVPRNNATFTPSQPIPSPPNTNLQTPQFQPVSPQILDNYRKQAVYPSNPNQQSTEKPIVYVMSNSSSNQLSSQTQYNIDNNGGTPPNFNVPPADSFTNYENNPVESPFQSPQPNLNNLNALSTESLSHVLADANAKAGEAMDKTIRFVIHKPEDENVVKNAILEDAQNRYEDVKFVQGPTLKVQRKETVYLPPKRKTVVYILLKEPQIDTDVEVMSPQEDDPVPEVYITYQKSDGHVKTKHYSPKPIKDGDMKKYLDLEAESESYSGEESSLQPKFSKSTSVSLSTSTKTSRKSASMSTSPSKPNSPTSSPQSKHEVSSRDLRNHKMTSEEDENHTPELKASPLSSNSTSILKKTRSSASLPSPRRFSHRHPIQCPTVT